MKIRSNIHAGNALQDCKRQRDYWKDMAAEMEEIANRPSPKPQPIPGPMPTPKPSGGGWVGGVYFSDRSGWCG